MFRTLALLSAVALGLSAHADVVTLTASADGTLFNDPTGAVANGSGPVMIVGRAGGASGAPIRRGLVRFDVAGALPAGSTVNSAQLVLTHTSGNTGARVIELHRVLADWGEGASTTTSGQGAAAEPGDATWLHRFHPSVLWSAPGGDFDVGASASQTVDAVGAYTWPASALATADVQGWLDSPSSNFGWLLKQDTETTPQTTKVFATREDANAAARPQLVVDFTPPPIFSYCTARVSSGGCTPSIGWSGVASASAAGGFSITLSQAPNQKAGLLVYGLNGPASQPFLGGLSCVAAPLVRTPTQWSGGNAVGADCSGAFSYDFNARIASGVDSSLTAGAVVHAQWRTRDPGNPAGSFLSSDAVRFVIAP